jgi:tetratricopeptide (TPR) repeat protein
MAEVVSRNSSVVVGRDALGNVFVTGDGNTVEVKLTVVVADNRLRASVSESSTLQNPYRGLDAFRETDSALFFGRDDLKTRLWAKFHALQRGHAPRLLPVLGASGAGKSSLVRAGLLPELVRQPMEGMRNPTVLVLRPGTDPLQRLAEVLARLAAQYGTAPTALATSSPDLVHSAARNIGDADHRVVIFVDQLEELFTECTSETARCAFLASLAHAAAQHDGLVSVVFAMRNDFSGSLRTHVAFATAVREQPFRVSQMSTDQLVEAIAQPAHVLGHPWPIGLVENLVLQCEGRAGALPLLQFALKRLWSEHVAGRLADSRWSSRLIEDFVVQVADTLYEGSGAERARDAHQRIIRRAFVAMVQLGEGAPDTRRVARLSEIVAHRETDDEVRAVLVPFAAPEARLVTVSESGGEPTYELAHEVLIGSWDQLSKWLGNVTDKMQAETIRSEVRLRRRLAYAASAWQRNRDALWRPPELELAVKLRDRHPEELSTIEHAFLDESRTAWESHSRWRRRAKAAAIVFMGLVSVLGVVAWLQREAAQENAHVAKYAEEQRTRAEANERKNRELVVLSYTLRARARSLSEPAPQVGHPIPEAEPPAYPPAPEHSPARAKSEPLYADAVDILEKSLGRDDPAVAVSLINLAALLQARGAYAKAEPLYTRALQIHEKRLGPNHPTVATDLSNLAECYQARRAYAKAEPLQTRALDIREKAFGPNHTVVVQSLNALAELYQAQGAYDKALRLYTRALDILDKSLGPNHPDVARSLDNLARLYQTQGAYSKVEPLYTRALQIYEKVLGPDHPAVATSLNNLAGLYLAQGAYAKAEPLYTRVLHIYEKALGPNHPTVAASLNNLAGLYQAQGAYAKAEPLFARALEILGKAHPDVAAHPEQPR